MTYSYFPGCTLKNKALDLDKYARVSAEALGFTLEEIPEWQCCGGEYPMGKDEIATKLSSVRALAASRDDRHDLVTILYQKNFNTKGRLPLGRTSLRPTPSYGGCTPVTPLLLFYN